MAALKSLSNLWKNIVSNPYRGAEIEALGSYNYMVFLRDGRTFVGNNCKWQEYPDGPPADEDTGRKLYKVSRKAKFDY